MSINPYSLDSCFDRQALETPQGRRKAELFAALVPTDCRTILDAGGGTGWTTIGLRERCEVVTLDSCAESLLHASGRVVQASVDALPLADRSFDLVISSQVLEHLPDETMKKTVAEMTRVAKRYLLVSVPYREALEARVVRCGGCGLVFHPDYHCRSFSESDLAGLFPGWLMTEWHVFGPLRRGLGVLKARGKARTEDIWAAYLGTVCPACGRQGCDTALSEPVRKPFALRVVNGIGWRLRKYLGLPQGRIYTTFLPQAVAPFWVTALFVRENLSKVDGAEATCAEPAEVPMCTETHLGK